MNPKQRDHISKFLSWVLRHEPQAIGLQLDTEGWADVASLIEKASATGQALNREMLAEVVDTNAKKRFSFSPDGQKIRAAQGHSTDAVQIQHAEKQPPEILFHGTASRFLEAILAQGLLPQARHHVHLSADEETAQAVGKRYGKPVVLRVLAGQMHQAGYPFFQADNGVWLTHTVPPAFLLSTTRPRQSPWT